MVSSFLGTFSYSQVAAMSSRTTITTALSAIDHILITGQSNSQGADAFPPLTTIQKYNNKMFAGGVRSRTSPALTSFVPLIETQEVDPVAPSGTDDGETIASAMTDFLSQVLGSNTSFLASAHGDSGYTYNQLKRGSANYNNGITQVNAAKNICNNSNMPYKVTAVCSLHGEADQNLAIAGYRTKIQTWQVDYETDVKAITGQTGSIPLFICQQSYHPASTASPQTNSTAIELWKAHRDAPSKIILIGPRYPYDHVGTNGLVHLSNHGQRWHGEQYGKVYKKVIIDGQVWRPLSPKTVSLNGNIIDIDLYVPHPPLVFDLKMVVAPNTTALGFEYWDNTSPPAITNVEITGSNTVRITLASAPTGTGKQIRYAYTPTATASAGRWVGVRGNLRDSDPTISPNGYPLYNWCIHFALDIP